MGSGEARDDSGPSGATVQGPTEALTLTPWAWRLEARFRWLRWRASRVFGRIPASRLTLIWVGLLLVIALATFAPVLPAGMRMNPAGEDHMLARIGRTYGFRHAGAYFSPRFFERECQQGVARSELTIYYRPLMFLSYAFDAALWDCDVRVGRTVNLLLHVANAFVLGLLLLALSGGRRAVAVAGSLLYLVTPTSADPIGWWAARSDVLSTLLSLIGLLALVWWSERGGWRYLVVSVASLICAVLTKDTAGIVFPLACLWLLLAPKSQKSPPVQRALLIAGLAALAVAYLVFRIETHTLVRPPAARVGAHYAVGQFVRFLSMPLFGLMRAVETASLSPLDLGGVAALAAWVIILWPSLRPAIFLFALPALFFLPAMFYGIIEPRYRYAAVAGSVALVALLCGQADRRCRSLWAPVALVPWVFAAVLFCKDLVALHQNVIFWAQEVLSRVVRP